MLEQTFEPCINIHATSVVLVCPKDMLKIHCDYNAKHIRQDTRKKMKTRPGKEFELPSQGHRRDSNEHQQQVRRAAEHHPSQIQGRRFGCKECLPLFQFVSVLPRAARRTPTQWRLRDAFLVTRQRIECQAHVCVRRRSVSACVCVWCATRRWMTVMSCMH